MPTGPYFHPATTNPYQTSTTAGSPYTVGSITINGQPLPIGNGYTISFDSSSLAVSTCLSGHTVEEWAEYPDGEIVGLCSICTTRVTAKRVPGGLPVVRLKALVERLLAEPEALDAFLELNEYAEILDQEQAALDEAKALLATARTMIDVD